MNSKVKLPATLQKKADEASLRRESQQYELPMWDDPYRAMPNELVRSALFAVRDKRAPRQYLKDTAVAMIGNGKLTYTGEELRQDDETVWMHLVNLSHTQGFGTSVQFTPYSFCKAIGWPTNQTGYKRLRDSMDRMKFGGIKLNNHRIVETGLAVVETGGGLAISLIRKFVWEGQDGAPATIYTAELEREAAILFSGGYFSLINWEQRKLLPTGLATWLHSFFSSHRDPIPLNIEQIRLACGAQTALRQFKQKLKIALEALIEVGFLISYEIKGNILKVTRSSK
ncbi:plasmid replication initiator TrfA [Chromobacterium vaccinii]|uniref:plasmid replication initiator TrfA n=1 Tax=Chromobacterium vaccinii TaxID=1108595 RepID=UPI0031D0CE13